MLSRRRLLKLACTAPMAGRSLGQSSRSAVPPAEIRQLVSFRFAPGKTAEAIASFRDQALPLYEENPAMLRFRGFREVESPIPVDLILVSTFHGMAGMDESNDRLRTLADAAGTSIGAIYGHIGALSIGHYDEFVRMLGPRAEAATGSRLVLLEYVELVSESVDTVERLVIDELTPWEREAHILESSESGRVLIGSGWHYVRFLGIDRLAAIEDHLSAVRSQSFYRRLAPSIRRVQRVVLATVPELSVR